MNITTRAKLPVIAIAFTITITLAGSLAGCAGTPVPPGVGVLPDGSIPLPAPPPSSPNCVSSYVDPDIDGVHGMLPIERGNQDARDSQTRIRTILESEERTEILTDISGYIHAVQYTRIWRFPDDVEFWFPAEESVVHFRSAARLGRSDLGVNRKRMERIRKTYSAG